MQTNHNLHSVSNDILKLTTKWGSSNKYTGKVIFKRPKWARLRLYVEYANGSAKYPSMDYTYSYPNGVKTKDKSESVGLQKLIEMQHKWLKEDKTYKYINVFCNLTNNLDTETGNFDYLVCTIVAGQIKWKDPIYWLADNPAMMDIKRMREYRDNKNK